VLVARPAIILENDREIEFYRWMKGLVSLVQAAVSFAILLPVCLQAQNPSSTAFTYQGRLTSGASAANGSYDLTFSLFGTNLGGAAIAGKLTNSAVLVSNGLFTAVIDFGSGAFISPGDWLEISVRTNGIGGFTTLSPRQPITATPYAITAQNVSGLVVQQNTNGAPNVIEGSTANYLAAGIIGATISGGGAINDGGNNLSNSVTANYGTVGGGARNAASGPYATVGGGAWNSATGYASVVAGGGYPSPFGGGNTAGGDYSIVGGGAYNLAATFADTVAGGYANVASGGYATVSGGEYNLASGFGSVAGGYVNSATNQIAIAAGGYSNRAYGYGSTVSGGYNCLASGDFAAIGGGRFGIASGNYAFLGGGLSNLVSGFGAVVPGGSTNTAAGTNSLAAGSNARAMHDGTFVWGDNTPAAFASSGSNQFLIRAKGGVGIGTASPASALDVRGDIHLGTNGQFYAPGGEENLRIIRGVINSAGVTIVGSGFTVTHPATGQYTVTFNTPFPSAPAVTTAADSGGGASRMVMTDGVTGNYAAFRAQVSTSGAPSDFAFHFIAIGPR
jgi:hypothetical protein